jgi:hypothetical protein
MKKCHISLSPFLLIILMGCPMGLETSEPSAAAKKALNKYGAQRIINDGKMMLEKIPSNGPVSSSKWPESIAAFKPKMVVSGSDRIRLILNKKGRYENGIIIYTTIPERIQKNYDQGVTILSAGSGYGEFKMARGISWYYQKGRY